MCLVITGPRLAGNTMSEDVSHLNGTDGAQPMSSKRLLGKGPPHDVLCYSFPIQPYKLLFTGLLPSDGVGVAEAAAGGMAQVGVDAALPANLTESSNRSIHSEGAASLWRLAERAAVRQWL